MLEPERPTEELEGEPGQAADTVKTRLNRVRVASLETERGAVRHRTVRLRAE